MRTVYAKQSIKKTAETVKTLGMTDFLRKAFDNEHTTLGEAMKHLGTKAAINNHIARNFLFGAHSGAISSASLASVNAAHSGAPHQGYRANTASDVRLPSDASVIYALEYAKTKGAGSGPTQDKLFLQALSACDPSVVHRREVGKGKDRDLIVDIMTGLAGAYEAIGEPNRLCVAPTLFAELWPLATTRGPAPFAINYDRLMIGPVTILPMPGQIDDALVFFDSDRAVAKATWAEKCASEFDKRANRVTFSVTQDCCFVPFANE
jgi:hypothetical protein